MQAGVCRLGAEAGGWRLQAEARDWKLERGKKGLSSMAGFWMHQVTIEAFSC